MLNTALYAGGGALLSVVVSALTGYALAKFEFRGRSTLFNLLLAGVLVPPVVLALPQYLLLAKVGLTNTYWSVLLPSILSPYGIYLARIYAMSAVPDEVIESARVDGCPEGHAVRADRGADDDAGAGDDLPVPVRRGVEQLPAAVHHAQRREQVPAHRRACTRCSTAGRTAPALYSLVVTGSLLSIIPLIILFLALQRYWRTDIASGAVKQ